MERLAGADRRVLRRGSRITAASPAEDLHDLRKRAKELRYLLETFAPLLDPGDARGAVKELKALQDVLGTFQDSEAQREAIYALATDMMAREGRLRPDDPRHGGDRGPAAGGPGLVARGVRRHVRAVRAAVRCSAGWPGWAARTAPAGSRHRVGRSGAMKVVATYNIKGGVGKTSTAVNIAYLAARDGLRTLIWDLDPQGSATYLFRVKPKVKGGGKALVAGRRTLGRGDQGDRLRPARSDAGRLQLPQPRPRPGLHQAPHGPAPPPDRAPGGRVRRWSSSTARPACPWCRRTSSTPATCCSSR